MHMISKLPLIVLLLLASALTVSTAALAQVPAEQAPPAPPAQQQPAPPYAGQPAVPQQYPQQYAPPAPVYPPSNYPYAAQPPARPSKGMLITGISILGGGYLVSALTGALLMDDNCIDCGDIGPYLFIPVLGPFLAIPQSVDGAGVLALLGVVQTVGAGLTIGGIIRYKNTKRRAEESGYYTFQLPEGRSLALDMSLTPRKLGPQLKLTF
jgi:hypothetical protein